MNWYYCSYMFRFNDASWTWATSGGARQDEGTEAEVSLWSRFLRTLDPRSGEKFGAKPLRLGPKWTGSYETWFSISIIGGRKWGRKRPKGKASWIQTPTKRGVKSSKITSGTTCYRCYGVRFWWPEDYCYFYITLIWNISRCSNWAQVLRLLQRLGLVD